MNATTAIPHIIMPFAILSILAALFSLLVSMEVFDASFTKYSGDIEGVGKAIGMVVGFPVMVVSVIFSLLARKSKSEKHTSIEKRLILVSLFSASGIALTWITAIVIMIVT